MDELELQEAIEWLVVSIMNHPGQPQNPDQLPYMVRSDILDVVRTILEL